MNELRTIRKIVTGKHTVDGAGVKLVRVIGHDDIKEFDPFLMLDAFDSVDPNDYIKGFPWHPHRPVRGCLGFSSGSICRRKIKWCLPNIMVYVKRTYR
ncbi:MAG: Pirin domain protein [Anaerospora sp.]|nr:Pirin domain protein [Anaerospora sp.]